MPFYKLAGTELLEGGGRVAGPGFDLQESLKNTYTYPVFGWMWHPDRTTALEEMVLKKNSGVLTVSMRQAQLALNHYTWLDEVEAVVAGGGLELQISWRTAPDVERTNPLVNYVLGTLMGKSEQEIDAVFQFALTL